MFDKKPVAANAGPLLASLLMLSLTNFAVANPATPDSPSREDYLQRGKVIALNAKAALGGQLAGALADGGPVSALAFCHENAIEVTERAARELGAGVSRVSDQPRNPDNAASGESLAYLQATKAALAEGRGAMPALREIDGRKVGFYPIVTNAMCLQCHGTPGRELKTDTLKAINRLYPDDQATGYGLNELRGAFIVTME